MQTAIGAKGLCLVINLGMQSRNNLELLWIILVVLPFDFRCLRPSLLLTLPDYYPFFHRQALSQPREFVLGIAIPLHEGTVLDRIQANMVIRSASQRYQLYNPTSCTE